jgi:hypothetical protein
MKGGFQIGEFVLPGFQSGKFILLGDIRSRAQT